MTNQLKLPAFRDSVRYLKSATFFVCAVVVPIFISVSSVLASSARETGNAQVLVQENFHFSAADTGKVYTMVDQMPEMVGGLKELYKNISYPSEARSQGIEGRVFIKFVVDENGNVQNPEIMRDIGGGCGDAAIKAIKKVKFTPGQQGGNTVKVQYSLPITFKLKS